MGELNVQIRHGGGSNPLGALMNPKVLVIGALVVVISAGGGAGAVTAGLTDLLYWVGGVLAVALAVTGWLVVRNLRRNPVRAYIKSVHGATQRDREIDRMAELRREIALTRAARWQLDVARVIQESAHPDYIHQGTITGRIPAPWPQESIPARRALDPGHE